MPDINLYAPQSGRVIGEDGKIYNIVDLLSNGSSNTPQQVTVTNPPKTVGVGNILSGTVDPNNAGDYPKLIAPNGATAIEIQCPQDNTSPLLVSNMSMDFGDWEVYPGTSKVFYFNTLYIRLPQGVTDVQKVTYMAVAQQ